MINEEALKYERVERESNGLLTRTINNFVKIIEDNLNNTLSTKVFIDIELFSELVNVTYFDFRFRYTQIPIYFTTRYQKGQIGRAHV